MFSTNSPVSSNKPPRLMVDGIFAFSPNRNTMGGTAYFIHSEAGNLLVDCPTWDEGNQQFLQAQGGVSRLFLTHRDAIAKVKEIQQFFNCEVLIQEQEAYLLPDVAVTAFHQEMDIAPGIQAIWTPGYSPGSACLYCDRHAGILFSGRHLLPNQQGEPVPLRFSKTFHWRRQIQSVQNLRDRFSADTLTYLCPGANTGFLRGQRWVDRAYERLAQLDLAQLLQVQPGL
jgi:glyoxylase-like metal-dependent hydrolase (beta-lactamase superfamily II)